MGGRRRRGHCCCCCCVLRRAGGLVLWGVVGVNLAGMGWDSLRLRCVGGDGTLIGVVCVVMGAGRGVLGSQRRG